MVFNSGDFKNGISFSFRIPPDPPKGAAVAACAAVTAKIENTHKKSCDTSILWFSTVGISKMGSVFLLGYPNLGVHHVHGSTMMVGEPTTRSI